MMNAFMIGFVGGIAVYSIVVKGYAYYLAKEEIKAKQKEYEENKIKVKKGDEDE